MGRARAARRKRSDQESGGIELRRAAAIRFALLRQDQTGLQPNISLPRLCTSRFVRFFIRLKHLASRL